MLTICPLPDGRLVAHGQSVYPCHENGIQFGPYLTTALDEVGCDVSLSWVGLGWVVLWWASVSVSVSVSGGCCVVVGSGSGGRGAKPRVGGCALCWVGLGSVVVGLGSLVWWASVSVSGGCCVVVGGGGGGRGAKPRVGGCALGVGRCVFRGLGQDFAKMVHFRPSENLENNFRQHCTTRVPTYKVLLEITLRENLMRERESNIRECFSRYSFYRY